MGQNKSHKHLGPKKITQPLETKQKNHAASQDKKKSRNLSGPKITKPLGTKKIKPSLGTGNQNSIKSEEVGNRIQKKIRKKLRNQKKEGGKMGNQINRRRKRKKSEKVGNWKM